MGMKILIAFNHPAPYKVRLFNELSKHVDLDVIFERTSASDRPEAFYNCNEYKFNAMFCKNGYFSTEDSWSGELKRYIKKNYSKYDLVIMNGYSKICEMRAISYMNKHHLPYILYINGGVIHKENRFKRKLKTKYIRSASSYISPCDEADEYLLFYGAKKEKIYHYPYSTFYDSEVLNKPLTLEEKNIIREKYNLPKDKRIFVSPCQFIERKNNMFLMSFFKHLDANLLLIGDGIEKEKYQEYIKNENLNNVIIHPFMDKKDLFDVLKCCDFFVTLSKEDIYGHTTNEALACGLPVISSDSVISSRHLIKNGINGYLVSLDNKEEIANAFNLISNKMSVEAIKTAKEFTIEAAAKRHIEIFKELMK